MKNSPLLLFFLPLVWLIIVPLHAGVIPQPTSVTPGTGKATITSGSKIYYSGFDLAGVAQLLSDDVARVHGVNTSVKSGSNPVAGDVVLRLLDDSALGKEGYRMTVTDHVVIEAPQLDGFFAGSMTLLQLMTPDGAGLDVAQTTIVDVPYQSQRALMIDIKNQWHPISELEKFINLCRFYKVRHLSLHTGEEQWIGSVMDSTASISAANRQNQRLYTKAEIDGLIAYAAARGVYLFPHNETTEGFSGMRDALQNDFDGSGGYPNWVQEAYNGEEVNFAPGNAEGLDGFVDSDGNGVDDTDPDYWKAIEIFTRRSHAQFAAAYPDGKLPYYHMGPVQGEGGTSPANAEAVLDILRTVDAGVKLMFWNGMNAGGLSDRRDELIVCFYSKQFSSSDIYGYLNGGWNVLNSSWSPLYIVGSGIARTQQQVHDDWNTFRTGTDGFSGGGFSYGAIDWDEFDTAIAQSLVTGGMLCTWETPTAIHLDRVRLRLPAMSEHAWNHKNWPYDAADFANFRTRFLAADAILPAFLGVNGVAPSAPENLTASNGDIANGIEVSWRGSASFPDGYRVLRNTSDNLAGATQVAEISVDEVYLDATVTVNTPYYYWVKAFNESGESSLAGSVLGSAGDGIARTQAEEPFNYTAGQSIENQNGGAGWNGGWNLDSRNGNIQVVGNSLSYDNLPTSGGALQVTPLSDNPSIDITRNLEEALGAGGTTLWLSYLFRGNPVANGHAFVRIGNGPGVGKRWGSEFAFENDGAGVFMSSGQTYFIIVRYDFGATDNLYMWINPSLDSEPAIETADHATSADIGVDDSFLINIQGWGQGDYLVDEIRMGPSWGFATGGDGGAAPNDMDPPAPNPMTWISPPVPEGGAEAAMAATPATDPWKVEYYFEEMSGNPGGDDSDWQDSPNYTDSGLQPGNTYTYRVKARDKSPQRNETDWSFSSSVALSTPGEASPISPIDEAEDVMLNGTLEWTPGPGAASHDVYFGTTNPLQVGNFQGNQDETTFTPDSLLPSTIYYWRVDQVNAFGTTTGTTWSFTTGTLPEPGALLLHEEFDGYQMGTIIGQTGQGKGLSGVWAYQGTAGTFELGPGLSGSNGLVVTADGTGDLDAKITHTVPDWGTGVVYMSYLWNEAAFQGHAYVSAGGNFSGAFGHAWNTTWAIDNAGNGVGFNFGTTYRLVAKIDFDAGETTMWVDPVAETDTPVAFKPAVQESTPALILRYYGTDGTLDDIRIGMDFKSVISEISPPPLNLLDFSREGNTGLLRFTGTPGMTNLKTMGSTDLVDFNIDETPNVAITEESTGVYELVIDLTGYPLRYFLRLEN